MTEKIARNAPCPCGSGKKHKNCCLGKTSSPKRRLGILLVFAVGITAGVAVGIASDWVTGSSVGAGTLLIASLVLMFSNPPPPTG